MLKFVKGDMFNFKQNEDVDTEPFKFDAYVNPVNCVGIMGKGLAKTFKLLFPRNFDHYQFRCFYKEIMIGGVYLGIKEHDSFNIYFPTKYHWRHKSDLNMIAMGLKDLDTKLTIWSELYEIKSIAVPALGCGFGQLPWGMVKPLINHYLKKSSEKLNIIVFEPT